MKENSLNLPEEEECEPETALPQRRYGWTAVQSFGPGSMQVLQELPGFS